MPTKVDASQTFQFPEVRVVEASAGSGKTYALAKRYIQLLFNPALKNEQIPIRQILAITFTNKAAFEMKARILEFLKRIAFGLLTKSQEEDILHPIGVAQKDAQERAFAIMDMLIRHYNFFQVQTIDKFINALLSGCAFKIGLTANFKIKTNSDEYLQFSLDELIDRAPKDKDVRRVFEQFLHNYLYLENRTGWFPKKDMLNIIASLFSQYNAYGLPFEEGPYTSEDVIKKKKTILTLMKDLRGKLPEETDKRFLNSLDNFLKEAKEGFDIDSISDYFAREFIPLKKGAEATKELEKLWESIGNQLQQLCEEEAFSLFNPYIQAFAYVLKGMLSAASKDDVLFLSELNKKAGHLFDEENVTVPELYYRLATRFRHYLIDEFQDTSRLQWHNVEKMAEEALSTGGSLFYVGDRKQAIYGFRGGEVALFDSIKRNFEPFNVQVDLLNKNYRSLRAVVEFNNAVFSIDNLKSMIAQKEAYEEKRNSTVLFNEEDIADIENIFGAAQQTVREGYEGGYVKMAYVDIDKKEDRDEFVRANVLELIRSLRQRFAPKDIAILTRSNTQIEQLTNWLLEENIQVDSERTSNVKENIIVKEIVSLLTFLNSPIDNRSFAAFLLGETFPQMTGIKEEEIQEFLFSLRLEVTGKKDFYIYTAFRKKYEEVWDKYFNEFFQNVGLYPLYEMVVSIYSRFELLEHFPQYQGYLMHFLELIKKAEEDHPDLASFLEYYEELEGEELFVNIKDRNAVRILTIHKSKGLEFPVVILPFLGMEVQVGNSGENQQSYILHEDEGAMKLIRSKKKYLLYSETLRAIYRQEYKKAYLSELNNVYVALTRAQQELYGFIPKKSGQSLNLAKFLIPQDKYEMGGPSQEKLIKEEEKAHFRKIPPSQYQDWLTLLNEEFQEFEALKQRQKRLEGECAHYMLSFVKNLKAQDIKEVIQEAVTKATVEFPHIADFSSYEKLLGKVLKAQELKDFFVIEDGELFCEKEVVDKNGLTKRIDRLIIKKDETWIIDYKSAHEATGKQQEQLLEYREIISGIYPKHKIRCFIIYLDALSLEEVKV
ncbi:MAG TPA: UvrD-helicase domain-containing protein [Candidatus Omnitrophota bacterium]|nr:UvrD-helicase domain-containing protein [Candidatus Omnitrophota bacterium]